MVFFLCVSNVCVDPQNFTVNHIEMEKVSCIYYADTIRYVSAVNMLLAQKFEVDSRKFTHLTQTNLV